MAGYPANILAGYPAGFTKHSGTLIKLHKHITILKSENINKVICRKKDKPIFEHDLKISYPCKSIKNVKFVSQKVSFTYYITE